MSKISQFFFSLLLIAAFDVNRAISAGSTNLTNTTAITDLVLNDINIHLASFEGKSAGSSSLKTLLKQKGHPILNLTAGSGFKSLGIIDSTYSIGLTIQLTSSGREALKTHGNFNTFGFPLLVNPLGKTETAKYATVKVHPRLLFRLMNSGLSTLAAMDTKVGLAMDKVRVQSRLEDAWSGNSLLQQYKGKDVIFGLVDVGMDYRHTTFNNSNGSHRFIGTWLQAGLSNQNDYGYGKVINSSGIESLDNDKRDESHATHVAGIAAGRGTGSNTKYSGVAPEADIVVVSNAYLLDSYESTTQSTVLDGVDYIFSISESRKKPAVVNLSLATNIGPHDGSAIFDSAINEMQGIGKIVVTAAGNDGLTRLHTTTKLSPAAVNNQSSSIKTFIEQNSQYKNCFVDVWGDSNTEICIKLGSVDNNGTLFWDDNQYCTGSNNAENGFISILGLQYNIVARTEQFNSKPRLFLRSENTDSDRLCIEVTSPTGSKVHIWNCGPGGSSGENLVSRGFSDFYEGDNQYTIGEIGGNNPEIITVGAFTSTYQFKDSDGRDRQIAASSDNFRLAGFSSRGPNVNGVVKPDLTAAGSIITSSISKYDRRYTQGNLSSFLVERASQVNDDSPFAAQNGTSMSSPVVAGAVALMLQANPYLSHNEAREILTLTAYNDTYTTTIEPEGNNFWGHGKLDISAAVALSEQYFISSNPNSSIKVANNPINNSILKLIFEENAVGKYDIELYDTTGRLAGKWSEEVLSSGSPNIKLDITEISTGYYILRVSNQLSQKTLPINKY